MRGEPEEIRTPVPLAGRLLSRQAQLTTLPLALCACGGSPRIRTEKRDVLSVPGMPVPVNDPLRVVLPPGNDPGLDPYQGSVLPLSL